MNICECLTTTAQLFPERVAIVFDDQHWTYAQLEKKSLAAANWLSQQGVEAGDRIAIMLPNALSFPVWYYAALRIGAIAVSVSTRLAASEVAFVVEDCGATAFVASESALASVEAELPKDATVRLSVNDVGEPLDASVSLEETSDDRIADLSSRSRRSCIDLVHLRHDWVPQRCDAFARQCSLERPRLQSSLQHAARRPCLAGRAVVSLLRPKRIT